MRYKGVDAEICLSMDSHSANSKMAAILSNYFKNLGSAIGMRIGMLVSRCGRHRGSRICARHLEKHNLHTVFFGLSNVLRMRKTNRQVLKVLSEVDDGRVEICRFPPVLVDRDVRLVKTLREMLSLKWHLSGGGGDELRQGVGSCA